MEKGREGEVKVGERLIKNEEGPSGSKKVLKSNAGGYWAEGNMHLAGGEGKNSDIGGAAAERRVQGPRYRRQYGKTWRTPEGEGRAAFSRAYRVRSILKEAVHREVGLRRKEEKGVVGGQ